MDSREQATHDALYRTDPDLAGLFARGCELINRIEEPGVKYLIGHIGRELSKAVLRAIADELLPISGETAVPNALKDEDKFRSEIARIANLDPGDGRIDAIIDILGEDHRETIARALSLGIRHPLVSSWLQLQRVLVASTHYREKKGPSVDTTRDAFNRLAGLLFNRVGPYFKTQDEIDALASIAEPSAEHVARLRELMVRPQLRFRFFRSLRNAGWLPSLIEAGVFDNPPEMAPAGEGGWRLVAWPEGECLVRLARGMPDRVADVLLQVPRGLQNAAVWDTVAKAALVMPTAVAGRLIPLLAHALRNTRIRFFSDTAAKVCGRLAEAGEHAAFPLAAALLGLKAIPKDEGPEETRFFRLKTENFLGSLDAYELSEFLQGVVPKLAALDLMATWSLLTGRLRRARRLVADAGFDDDAWSQHWCKSLDHADFGADVRAQFAVAAMSVARRLLGAEPRQLVPLLASLPSDAGLLTRMRLALLAIAGPYAPVELNKEVADPQIVDPPFGAREVALLLRAQFDAASPEARAAFVQALEQGPGDDELRSVVEWRGDDPASAEARQEALKDWQRKRVRWFHDRIPLELARLAQRLGITAEKPTPRQQALDEVGVYSEGGVSWRGETSPKSIEELRALPDADVLTLLATWEPSGSFDSPSRRGLSDVLSTMVGEDPPSHVPLFKLIEADERIHASYRRAILDGLRKAAGQGRDVPWPAALDFISGTLKAAQSASSGAERTERRWARQEAIELLQEGCTNDRLPISQLERVFELTNLAVRTSPDWSGDNATEISTFGGVVLAALNSDAGNSTHLLIAAGLWVFRAIRDQGIAWDIVASTRPLLEFIRARDDEGRVAARARLGEFLPQVLLLDKEWVLANAEDLLGTGMLEPLSNPTWGAYITVARLHSDSFRVLRPWFGRHAARVPILAAAEDGVAKKDREWLISRHYAERAGHAYMYGFLARGEDDRALELVFEGSRAEDRAHFYWEVFRAWSDADRALPGDYVERLLGLWTWRLEELESKPPDDEVAEEADGLGWFILTPHLPDSLVLPLARRTMRLATAKRQTRRMVWPRLLELARVDVEAVVEMADQLIEAELADQWPHFDFDAVAPALRLGLASDNATVRNRTEWLVHRLGDRGWTEFGRLLRPGSDASQ